MKLPVTNLQMTALLPQSIDGMRLCARTVSIDGRVALLFSNAKQNWEKVNETRIDHPELDGTGQIVVVESDGRCIRSARFKITSEDVKFDLLGDGGWVIVRHDTRDLPAESPDAFIHNISGMVTTSFRVGGAVEFVQCNDAGQVVIGHGDEGGEGEGLTCYGSNGTRVFKYYYPGDEDEPDYGLASWCCYALNVTEEAIWTQYYVQMLVTKIGSDGSVSRWRPLRRGARAIANAGNCIGLVGRYDKHVSTLFVYRLNEPPKSKVVAITKLLCDGVPLTSSDEVIGRGDTLYIFKGAGLYKLCLRDIAAVAS